MGYLHKWELDGDWFKWDVYYAEEITRIGWYPLRVQVITCFQPLKFIDNKLFVRIFCCIILVDYFAWSEEWTYGYKTLMECNTFIKKTKKLAFACRSIQVQSFGYLSYA